MTSSTFRSSQGRSFRSKTRSLRRKATSRSILKSFSRGSDWMRSTMEQSCWSLASRMTSTGPFASSSFGGAPSSSLGLTSELSWARSASSRSRSAVRSLFSACVMRSSSLWNSASRQALRFLARSTRAVSRSRSSCFRCVVKAMLPPEPSARAPKISSTSASSCERQLTDLRSSSQESSSSVLTLSASFCEDLHLLMMSSAPSSTMTLTSWPQSFSPLRHVDAFHAASGSQNMAKPKESGVLSSARPRRHASTSPHCSNSRCMCSSLSSGARRASNR
mmetsp:Transcript_5563/g.16005  ORF Transcript_5563/g.16005 Transcript_5563/m.16005 type:complete len:277 (-) Transcript_5563:217-1047(-)